MSKQQRKKTDPAPARPAFIRGSAPHLVAVLFFFVVCLCSAGTVKWTALILLAGALAVGALRAKTLLEQVRWPLIALFAVVAMDFISTFYAVSGKFALSEFLKIAVSFAVVLIFLALAPKGEAAPGLKIAAVLARAAALMGVVSIDLLSTRWISGAVVRLLGLFGKDYAVLGGVEEGIRMTSLVQNPNVFAGVAGIGVLLSLGLVLSGEGEKAGRGHLVCLYINALAFVLAFSMGATATIAVAFVAYLLLEGARKRAGALVLMVETLVVVVAAVVPISVTSFGVWDGVQIVPLLCVVVGSAALCVLDRFVGWPLAKKLAGHGKVLLAAMGGLIAALLAVIVLAYNLTGGTELAAGETLRRSIYPKAGEYVVSAQVSGPVTVTIESQNKEQTMMHTRTLLYQGALEQAEFSVADDCLVVYFTFAAVEDVRLDRVTWSGPDGQGEVPLGYKLLPSFIANRVQGLFANQNAIQRMVFFEDGVKLFLRSPVFGGGIGYYENGIMSVQQFFYETKYAHNHYIQVMAETGIIGLFLFIGLLAVSAAAVLRARRKKPGVGLTAALGAALVFMIGHGGVEVVFSHFAYLPFAFGVFALINLCCASPVKTTGVKVGVLAGGAVVLAVFLGLLGGNVRAKHLVVTTPTFGTLDKAIKLDRYEWADYMLSYVTNAPSASDVPQVQEQAQVYAARLEQVDSNTIPAYLAEYYFANGNVERGVAMTEKYVTYVSSKAEAWQWAFDLLERYEEDSLEFRSGVAHIAGLMDDWNRQNMGEIVLQERNRVFLDRMGL
ncbi:MAG: O-antigen ligase family protein [Oscillospiraceae bacterium]|nr:O-antigen ligase family protein [Oscillospiraceae bacterium]